MGGARPQVRFTGRAEGDLRTGSPGVERRRRQLVDLPWTWLSQVHGRDVVAVHRPGEHAGVAADAAVTAVPGAVLAVQVADCVPVALLAEGAVGVVHAGWRSLLGGVVEAAASALGEVAGPGAAVRAVVGPGIGPECYEFGADDLASVAARYGDGVVGATASGRPALDLRAAVDAALASAGVGAVEHLPGCTACDADRWWSHRARGDTARQAVVAWLA